jgi:SUKH-4 immunity protein
MNPSEFINAWSESEQNLQPISLQTLTRFELDNETVDFLFQSGLPNDAAPFLSFVGDIHPSDKYSTISFLSEWFNFLEPEYRNYVVVGSDGSGDIIAINTKNNFIIEWLDHEDYFSSRFMNSSISQLANCLLCYRDFIKKINPGKTADECFDTEFTDGQFETLLDLLASIDQRAVQEGFWKEELELLLANREDARSKH